MLRVCGFLIICRANMGGYARTEHAFRTYANKIMTLGHVIQTCVMLQKQHFQALTESWGSVAEWASAHQQGARKAKARASEPRDLRINPDPCPLRSGRTSFRRAVVYHYCADMESQHAAKHVTFTLFDDYGKFYVVYDLSANRHHWCRLSSNSNCKSYQ
uniref:Uncharacterized protein n=1 Tax=Ixodes ricinus TaxID=34613 RepID=A0A6B0UWL0_IXORI